MDRLLVVDDEPSIREFFEILLTQEGYEVELVSNGKEALRRVEEQIFDLVITDLAMPEVDGMKVLEKVKEMSPDTLVLMITAYATTESAVEAMKLGAYDYLMKPFKIDEIRLLIRNALEKSRLRKENRNLKEKFQRRNGKVRFVGVSPKMKEIMGVIERVAGGKSSILIQGESGTGKELVARKIHEKSQRVDKPFVSINCAAIPESLIESELFGYLKGSFTGANANKMGLFESAHQGTLFLDEIGELPSSVQAKLLRVLQERVLRRIGSTTSTPIDVRILSASNRDLEKEAKEGRFREDLFYRLNVIEIRVPPLRERMEDVPLLISDFLTRFSSDQEKRIDGMTPEALEKIMEYSFPGNVRELENLIEQSVALESSTMIQLKTLPEKIRGSNPEAILSASKPFAHSMDLEKVVEQFERELILGALRQSGGIRKKAAELLHISFRSMRYRMIKHGISQNDKDEIK